MKLSVIVPTFNEEAVIETTLRRAVEALSPYELIVADGCSRDGTVANARPYATVLTLEMTRGAALNHAAAVSMVDGPARALDLIDALEARGGLRGYELLPAVRADLLRRLGRRAAAREAYLAATAATQLEPLRRLYARRLAELDGRG